MTSKIHRTYARVMALLFASSVLGGCQTGEDPATALAAANLEKAVYCMELLEKFHDLKTAERECFTDTYIQHTPRFPDGPDVVLEAFAARQERNPLSTIEIKRTAAQGDLVWIHLHSKSTPDALGNAVVNIFRMRDGKFVEHWNVVQPVQAESANENSVF